MTYSSGSLPMPPMIGPYTFGLSPAAVRRFIAGYPSSSTWESAARAVFFPILLPSQCVARRVWWANGATTTGGATVEAGIYVDAGFKPGVKLITGSATQGTASQVQFVDITDTALSPGLWWLALMMSSATNTTAMSVSASAGFQSMKFQEASANPLPSTATPVVAVSGAVPMFGFATTASP